VLAQPPPNALPATRLTPLVGEVKQSMMRASQTTAMTMTS